MEELCLKDGERIDRLGYQGLRIIQNPDKFKFTIDAFLLYSFIAPRPDHSLIDLGTGGGVLPLLIAGQLKVNHVLGIEIQPELAEMAARSVLLNELGEKIRIIEADLKNPPAFLKLNSFDYVISNPPFFPVSKGAVSGNAALAMAKFEIGCAIDDVVKTAARLVKANGKVVLIFPSARFTELFLSLANVRLVPKRIRFIHPRQNAKSNLMLVEARPMAKPEVDLLPPLIIYNEAGEFTEEMNQIFHGKIS